MNLHMVLIEVEHWATLVLVFIGYRWLLFHSLVFSIHVLWIVFFFFAFAFPLKVILIVIVMPLISARIPLIICCCANMHRV